MANRVVRKRLASCIAANFYRESFIHSPLIIRPSFFLQRVCKINTDETNLECGIPSSLICPRYENNYIIARRAILKVRNMIKILCVYATFNFYVMFKYLDVYNCLHEFRD